MKTSELVKLLMKSGANYLVSPAPNPGDINKIERGL